ncbi:MAG: hypothetical protein ABJA37_08020 [Ferruginibacter sp.]
MKTIKFLIPVLLLVLISCNSTKITSSWKAPGVQKSNYNKIIVFGIFNPKGRTMREYVENELVSQLKSLGYNAVSALAEFGPKAFAKVKEEDLTAQLKSTGYDAVLTTVLLDKAQEKDYNPGNVSYQPVGYRYNRFGRYYTTIYDRVYEPGYYTTSTNYFLESNLYDLGTSDLIYSVQSKAFSPSSSAELANDYSKRIVKDLKTKGVLTKKNN